jgi:hypothetical protein
MPQPPIRPGDRLSRRQRSQYQYSKSLFKKGIDSRTPSIESIEVAIVEGLSDGGCWVRTPGGEVFHVSHFSIEVGDWARIENKE